MVRGVFELLKVSAARLLKLLQGFALDFHPQRTSILLLRRSAHGVCPHAPAERDAAHLHVWRLALSIVRLAHNHRQVPAAAAGAKARHWPQVLPPQTR